MRDEDAMLEYLLDLNGEAIYYDGGYVARIKVVRTKPTPERPHGVSYSLTLHAPNGDRIMGYDNAHRPGHRGSKFKADPAAHDHWHRDKTDQGRPYAFTSAERLIGDFFDEIQRVLKEEGQ